MRDLYPLVASCFASGSRALGEGLDPGVGPLNRDSFSIPSTVVPESIIGRWACLIIHPERARHGAPELREKLERAGQTLNLDPELVYYAFVTRQEGSEDFTIGDLAHVLKTVGTPEAHRLAEWWIEHANENPRVRFYDRPDLKVILKRLYTYEQSEQT